MRFNPKTTTVSDIKTTFLAENSSIGKEGKLVEINSNILEFDIKRLFFVYDTKKYTVRGNHANKKSAQALLCLNGEIDIDCFDGKESSYFSLVNPLNVITIPPGIFNEIIYIKKNSILLSICDSPYEKSDYITNFDKFTNWKKKP